MTSSAQRAAEGGDVRVGGEAGAALRGDAGGVEGRVGLDQTSEVQRKAQGAADLREADPSRIARDKASAHDPTREVSGVESRARGAQAEAAAKADVKAQASARVDAEVGSETRAARQAESDVRRTVDDPRGAATSAATAGVESEVRARTPIDPSGARSDVAEVRGAVANPEAAAGARVDVAVESKQREVTADVGIDVTKKPDKP